MCKYDSYVCMLPYYCRDVLKIWCSFWDFRHLNIIHHGSISYSISLVVYVRTGQIWCRIWMRFSTLKMRVNNYRLMFFSFLNEWVKAARNIQINSSSNGIFFWQRLFFLLLGQLLRFYNLKENFFLPVLLLTFIVWNCCEEGWSLQLTLMRTIFQYIVVALYYNTISLFQNKSVWDKKVTPKRYPILS